MLSSQARTVMRQGSNQSFWEELESQMSREMDEREARRISAGAFLTNSVTAMLGCGCCAAYAGVVLTRSAGFDPAAQECIGSPLRGVTQDDSRTWDSLR